MKRLLIVFCLSLGCYANAWAQYVPKDKRKTPVDTIKTQPQVTQPREREPMEKRFIGYAMAFPNFLQTNTRFTINGGTASLNIGYRLHEKLNMGIATSYGYQNYNNVTIGSSGNLNGYIRSTGAGVFGQFHFNESYFAWAEYSNLFTKTNDRAAQIVTRSWYAQPLFGVGARYQFGENSGVATMLLFNPRYGDPYSPYRSILVQRILFYFHF